MESLWRALHACLSLPEKCLIKTISGNSCTGEAGGMYPRLWPAGRHVMQLMSGYLAFSSNQICNHLRLGCMSLHLSKEGLFGWSSYMDANLYTQKKNTDICCILISSHAFLRFWVHIRVCPWPWREAWWLSWRSGVGRFESYWVGKGQKQAVLRC